MQHTKTKILDCTLRDGGYYNAWNFNKNLLKKYFTAIEHSTVTYIELGFRFVDQSSGLGPLAYSSEEFINNLDLPKDKSYGVMINAKDYITLKDPIDQIKKTFINAKKSKISFVRIAVDLPNVSKCKHIAKVLNSLGYSVMVNLMQANLYPESELTKIIRMIRAWKIFN